MKIPTNLLLYIWSQTFSGFIQIFRTHDVIYERSSRLKLRKNFTVTTSNHLAEFYRQTFSYFFRDKVLPSANRTEINKTATKQTKVHI